MSQNRRADATVFSVRHDTDALPCKCGRASLRTGGDDGTLGIRGRDGAVRRPSGERAKRRAGARREPAELRTVHLAVGGRAALVYLPLTVTERLGYFR